METKKRKSVDPQSLEKRPRVHAQRKFAQGQGIFAGVSSSPSSPLKKGNNGQHSSGSSTASGPTSKNTVKTAEPRKGECPKTEDFLTFLCLRGTNLCPPEFDIFNKATLPTAPNQSSTNDQSSENEDSNDDLKAKRKRKVVQPKVLPESLKALKKKYTEQRIVRTAISQKAKESAVKLRQRNVIKTDKKANSSDKTAQTTGLRRGLRSSRATRASVNRVQTCIATRRPSAAAIIAKQKRRMATLNVNSKGVSRMLTRLTPRGTSNAAFVKKAKKMPLEGKSLRGRNISLSSEEEEEEPEGYKGRKMVCRKTASNVQRSDSDEDEDEDEEEAEEEEEEEVDEDEEKPLKRPARKSNVLTKKPSKEYDDMSVESLNEATNAQCKRLEQEQKRKVKYKEKKIITPSIIKKKKETPTATTADTSLDEMKKVNSKKDKDKVKTKNLLKEVQDRLLMEAKKKIASTPEASPLIPKEIKKEESVAAQDRITISQKTGYIQVKRTSTDQDQEPSTPPAMTIQQRRLSSSSCPTPPRKILPKEPTTTHSNPEQAGHLPVGVVSAALSSARPATALVKELQTSSSNGPSSTCISTAVPLSQPLLINTSINNSPVPTMVTQMQLPTGHHPAGPGANIISAIRMPTTIIRPSNHHGPVPIIMPQIALPNGSILQPVSAVTSSAPTVAPMQHPHLRPPQFYGMPLQHHPAISLPPQMIPLTSIASSSSSASTSKCSTDVTIANTQPMVSPGPPLLSPQFQQHMMQKPDQRQRIRAPNVPTLRAPPPVLTPSNSAPAPPIVTSGAVIRSVAPMSKSKTQFSRMPTVSAATASSSVISAQQNKPKSQQSFKVDGESSPYAFEPEPLEIRPSIPYRKKQQAESSSSSKTSSRVEPTPSADKKMKLEDFNLKDLNSSISLPPELANQLAAQAQAEQRSSGPNSTNETTYFIPLQNNSSGQSFGVAVKLGTEGPPGPDQKVIMKAKLVTQPVGKATGATVITAADKNKKSTSKKTNKKVVQQKHSSSSSSSSSNEDSSSDEEPVKLKKKGKSPAKKEVMKTPSPPQKKKKKEATVIALPVTSPTISSRSQQTCLGVVEALDKFPKLGQHGHLIEAPIFKPTEKEFKDPVKYIQAIRKVAEPFGMCKIIPPSSFKPECNVDDDMRFTAYNQYVHKLMNRWGPNSKEMAAIKKYLETQNVTINASNHPMVSGVEIDLPALYHAVQSLGGLTEVIQKKKWGKIAEFLRVPKGTQDRSNKFYDIYCKFLLPYDTLSKVEREELFKLVEEEFEERQKEKMEGKSKAKEEEDSDEEEDSEEEEEEEDEEDDECVLKGKSTSLSAFFRVAKNLMSMVFKDKFEGSNNFESNNQPELKEVEEEFWRMVTERDSHVQVQQGSIDTGSGPDGYGFPTSRSSSCGRHPWNLKILSNNRNSLLRTMGPVMGVTIPTLHVGMLFTTACWYRDPHGLPWIEYHHTGAPKVWFGIPDAHSIAFYTAMKTLAPTFCRNKKKIWLSQDTVMMPPNLLVKHGVSVSRCVQEAGQFMVVFPKAYTSHVGTGYTVSESVYFATRDYLKWAEMEFENIRDSRDPMLFPWPKLLICIAKDEKSSRKTLKMIKPLLEKMRDNEYVKRTMIGDLGVKSTERINLRSGSKKQEEEDEYECETCSANLYVSFVCDIKEDQYYCLDDAVKYLQTRKAVQRKHCKLLFTHSKEEISTIIKNVNRRLDEESSDEDSSDAEAERISLKKYSELNKEESKAAKRRDSTPPPRPASSSSSVKSPPALTSSSSKPKLSAPNVPPGTSINVSSFSLVKHATKKALADDRGSRNSKKSKHQQPPPPPPKKAKKEETESEDESEEASTSEEDSEQSNQEEDSDTEVKISKEAMKKAEKAKKQQQQRKKPEPSPSEKQASSKQASSTNSKNTSGKQSSAAKATNRKGGSRGSKEPTPGGSSSRRKTNARKASSSKTGNLASELLDMLLSTSNDEFDASESEQESSDENWK